MARRKLHKFAQNKDRLHIIEPGKPLYQTIKGNWAQEVFQNNNDLVLEMACGRGEYTVGLAEIFPDRNFIGSDIKGDRIWAGSNQSIEKGLKNVAFVRCLAQHIEQFFAPQELSEIWIIHPDPRPKQHDAKRRLTHPRFLDMYKSIMKPSGWIRLKTDSDSLYDYTLEVIKEYGVKNVEHTRELYSSPLYAEHHGIVTRYEKIFTGQGHSVKYIKFQFA